MRARPITTRMALGLMAAGWALAWGMAGGMAGAAGKAPGAPAVVRAPGGDELLYDVVHGDTLYHFAATWLVGPQAAAALAARNHIADPRRIPVGQRLHIPIGLLRTEATGAELLAWSGPVSLQGAGLPAAPRQGLVLGEGALLETGANAFVSLKLADGTVIAVPSQSLVRLAQLRRVALTGTILREIEVNAGRLHATVTPMSDPASTFRVKTPMAVSAVRGTDFRVAYTPGQTLSATSVSGGKVAVAGRVGEAMLPAGFGATSNADGTSAPIALLPAPALGSVAAAAPSLLVGVAPVAGASAYRVQLSRDAEGRVGVAEATGAALPLALGDVPSGDYVAHVSAIDGHGLEGLVGHYPLHRCHNVITAALSQTGGGYRLHLRFAWSAQADSAPTYHFRLMKAGRAAPVVERDNLTDTSLDLDVSAPGDYSWQVGSRLGGGAACDAWSAPETFHVRHRA